MAAVTWRHSGCDPFIILASVIHLLRRQAMECPLQLSLLRNQWWSWHFHLSSRYFFITIFIMLTLVQVGTLFIAVCGSMQ